MTSSSNKESHQSLFRVILPVIDIDVAHQFYSQILIQDGTRVSPGRHYFNLGGTILACYDPKADGDNVNNKWVFHENQYIYIAVNDLEEIHSRIKGFDEKLITGDIETMPWGERLFYAKDPFDTPICFVDESTKFMG
ncbi:VOC family protein [Ekhidna sp.]|uniref:VOC family protein n=1 Tax=Ekhidna sp. TaxID=2608089 RepID=UPI003CCC0B9C